MRSSMSGEGRIDMDHPSIRKALLLSSFYLSLSLSLDRSIARCDHDKKRKVNTNSLCSVLTSETETYREKEVALNVGILTSRWDGPD